MADDNSNVEAVNLSDQILTEDIISLLKKGLDFCPDYRDNICDMKIDLFKFIRRLKLQNHFSLNPTQNKD